MIVFTVEEMLKKRGMSMYALSKTTGIRPNTVSQWTNNGGSDVRALTIEALDKVCSALQCQPGDLLVHINTTPEENES